MSSKTDDTLPANRRGMERAEQVQASRDVVDVNARQMVTDLQREVIKHWGRVGDTFDAGEKRMDQHDEKLDRMDLKLDGLSGEVRHLVTEMAKTNALVQRGTKRITIAAVLGIWVCAGCLVGFMAFRVWPNPPWRVSSEAHAQE